MHFLAEQTAPLTNRTKATSWKGVFIPCCRQLQGRVGWRLGLIWGSCLRAKVIKEKKVYLTDLPSSQHWLFLGYKCKYLLMGAYLTSYVKFGQVV